MIKTKYKTEDAKNEFGKYSYDKNKPYTREDIYKDIKKKEKNSIEEIIYKTVLWKLNRRVTVDEEIVKLLNKQIKSENRAKKLLETLIPKEGYDLPMASTILNVYSNGKYPVFDQRAYRVAMKKEYTKERELKKAIDQYFKYYEKCKSIAKKR